MAPMTHADYDSSACDEGLEALRSGASGALAVLFERYRERLGRMVSLRMDRRVQLIHPHIVSVHDVGEHDGIHYYAMQYIPGQELDAVLR
jgi:hypothetical protein